MREEFADELAGDAGEIRDVYADTDGLLYDGYNNWDVGLLRFNGSELQYLGDGTGVRSAREHIQKVDCVSFKLHHSFGGIDITWMDLVSQRTLLQFYFGRATRTACCR